MSETQQSRYVLVTHGELHEMPEVNWENLRAKLIEKGVSEEELNRCIGCEPVPEGMRMEFVQ